MRARGQAPEEESRALAGAVSACGCRVEPARGGGRGRWGAACRTTERAAVGDSVGPSGEPGGQEDSLSGRRARPGKGAGPGPRQTQALRSPAPTRWGGAGAPRLGSCASFPSRARGCSHPQEGRPCSSGAVKRPRQLDSFLGGRSGDPFQMQGPLRMVGQGAEPRSCSLTCGPTANSQGHWPHGLEADAHVLSVAG